MPFGMGDVEEQLFVLLYGSGPSGQLPNAGARSTCTQDALRYEQVGSGSGVEVSSSPKIFVPAP